MEPVLEWLAGPWPGHFDKWVSFLSQASSKEENSNGLQPTTQPSSTNAYLFVLVGLCVAAGFGFAWIVLYSCSCSIHFSSWNVFVFHLSIFWWGCFRFKSLLFQMHDTECDCDIILIFQAACDDWPTICEHGERHWSNRNIDCRRRAERRDFCFTHHWRQLGCQSWAWIRWPTAGGEIGTLLPSRSFSWRPKFWALTSWATLAN